MRRRLIYIVGALAVVGVAVGVAVFVRSLLAAGKPADYGSAQSVAVHVITPKRGGLARMVTRPGSVHAFQFALLFAKVPG
jgi:hypothetical protein